MSNGGPEHFSCDTSLAADEPLDGKGTTGTHWLLLEADTPWPGRAIAEKELPSGVTDKLLDFKNSNDNGRVQFFRGEGDPAGKPRLMLARTDKPNRPLRCLQLPSYEAVLDLDFDALFEEPVPSGEEHEPVILVCTNGLRDACCAREGTSFYQALSKLDEANVFQTTHLGGHRFAANVLWLPYGILYSRLKPDQAGELLDLASRQEILLSNLRGRVNLPQPAQAADQFLRRQGDWRGLDDLEFQALEGDQPKWQVTFQVKPTRKTARVEVEFEPEVFQVYKTTGDEEPAMTGRFDCRVIEG